MNSVVDMWTNISDTPQANPQFKLCASSYWIWYNHVETETLLHKVKNYKRRC